MLCRNIDIDSGWVNSTLAVVIALTDNCIVVRKHCPPVSCTMVQTLRFRHNSEAEDLRIPLLLSFNPMHTPQELNLKDLRYCLCYQTEHRHVNSQQLPWVFILQLAGLLMLMGWRICGALVQFGCYKHRHK